MQIKYVESSESDEVEIETEESVIEERSEDETEESDKSEDGNNSCHTYKRSNAPGLKRSKSNNEWIGYVRSGITLFVKEQPEKK